jgi:hypothetical protein
MTIDATNPEVGASGFGPVCSSLARSNSPDPKPPRRPFQANNHVARRRRLVTHLHRPGAPLAHFISDIERGAPVNVALEAYAGLPADFIAAYGGDNFPPPMFAIRGGRE